MTEITGTIKRTTRSLVELVTGEIIRVPSPELITDTALGNGILKTFEENVFAGYDIHYVKQQRDDGIHHEFSFQSPEFDPVINGYPLTQYEIIEHKLN
jgi:hypothetical protein